MEKDTYPKKFDPSKINNDKKSMIEKIHNRRKLFDKYISDNNLDFFTCPSCGYPTIAERGGYEICDVCNWEDDNQDDDTADEIWGGPNGTLSLTESRLMIGKILDGLEKSLNGVINNSPQEILNILDEHYKVINEISIPGDAGLDDPVWKEWEKARDSVHEKLIKTA